MTHGFIESPQGLRYEEHISVPLRFFVGVLGLAMFLIPVPFVHHAHLGLPWWQLALAAFCVVLPCLVGGLFLMIALGRCLRLRFDSPGRRLTHTSRLPFKMGQTSIAYAHVESASLQERSSEDGPYFVIRLGLHGRRPMYLGSFDRREDGVQWRDRVTAQLQA
ncbi:MAG: hypothetical protein I8H77_03000 [Comamonadaceae bacterium]|nr:hypothetical protein [Comamonadaceae bacterium]